MAEPIIPASSEASPPPKNPKSKRNTIIKIVLLGFVGLVAIARFTSGDRSPSSSSGAVVTATSSPLVQAMPDQQRAFLALVKKAREEMAKAENDMQRGGALARRNAAFCQTLQLYSGITDWVGTVAKVSSNSDGKGVLSVNINIAGGSPVEVKTWNNAVSDFRDLTLLDSSSPLFAAASRLEKGASVRFSGMFMADSDTCIGEQSMTLRGKVEQPEFTFRFSGVERVK